MLDRDCDCPFKCVASICQIACHDASSDVSPRGCLPRRASASWRRRLAIPTAGADQFQGCGQNSDCLCPYGCFADIQRGAVCENRCTSVADCTESDEICETDAGSCQRTHDLLRRHDAGIPVLGACAASIQCACPLSCFDYLCEPACTVPSDCAPVGDAGQFCEGDGWLLPPDPGLQSDRRLDRVLGCTQTTDCQCPFECVVDPRRGAVCELPCTSAVDCASDEICEGDAGACQRTSSCWGGDAGLVEWSACTEPAQCACPLTCLIDPSFTAASGLLLCEQCDAGTSCAPPGGACVDAGALAAQTQYGADSSLWTACSDSSVCDCPNQCLPIAGGGSFACQLPPRACTTTADCPDPTTFCASGGCIPNICPAGAVVTQPCDVAFGQNNPALTGDGQCLPNVLGGATLLCVQGGTATGACSLPPNRNDPTTLCPSGSTCAAADGGNICAEMCQIGSLPDCDGGSRNCASINPAYPSSCPSCTPPLSALQACLPGQGAGTDDLPTYEPVDGPFDSSGVGVPFAPCSATDCLCPSSCVYDFFLSQISYDVNGTYCEQSCSTSGDCPWPQTNCSGEVCALDRATCTVAIPSQGVASNLGAACSNSGAAGTCVYFSPFVLQPEPATIFTTAAVALCRVNGKATASCDPSAARGAAGLCGAGTDCFPLGDGGYGCLTLCDPLSVKPSSCAAGQTCAPITRFAGGIDEGICVDLADGGCAMGLPSAEFEPCRVERRLRLRPGLREGSQSAGRRAMDVRHDLLRAVLHGGHRLRARRVLLWPGREQDLPAQSLPGRLPDGSNLQRRQHRRRNLSGPNHCAGQPALHALHPDRRPVGLWAVRIGAGPRLHPGPMPAGRDGNRELRSPRRSLRPR